MYLLVIQSLTERRGYAAQQQDTMPHPDCWEVVERAFALRNDGKPSMQQAQPGAEITRRAEG